MVRSRTRQSPPRPPAAQQSARHQLAVILLAQFIIPLSISGTAVALPRIAAELGSSPMPLQWVVNGFNVAFAVCTIIWGMCSDRIGHSRAFRLGILIAVIGGVLSLCAPSILALDAGRIIAGIGSAAVLTGAAPLISHLFTGADRARAFALFGTINGLGLAAGPALSGLILAVAGWRGIFTVHVAALLIALIGTVRLPVLPRRVASLRQMFDLSALRAPRFLAMVLVPVAGALGFVTFLTYLPSALQAIHGLAPGLAGVLMLAMTIPVLAAPAAVHRLLAATRVRPTTVVLISFGCLLAGAVGVLGLLRPDVAVPWAIVPMILLGLGFGLPLGFVDAEALAAVPTDRAGAASGVVNLFRIGSEAVFVAGYAAVLSAVVTSALPGAAGQLVASGVAGHPWAYYDGLRVAALATAIGTVVLWLAFVALTRAATRVSAAAQVTVPEAVVPSAHDRRAPAAARRQPDSD